MKIKLKTIFTIAVFIFIAGLLIAFEAQPGFPDPDSFYHAKMATVIRDQGFIETFPWFQWMDFKNVYVNPHLLYHILLIPFVTIFNPLIGIRISAVIFGLLAFLAIYLTARSFKASHPWLYPLIAALTTGFLFRMSLPRAPSLSVAFLLLATWAMLKQRPKILFFTSLFFAWLYHGWPVIFLSLGAVVAATFVAETLKKHDSVWSHFKNTYKQQKWNTIATVTGVLAGLIINPYFPQNIQFSILDIFKIGIVNYQSILSVGQEWFPYTADGFLMACFPALLTGGLALAFFIPGLISTKKMPPSEQVVAIFTFLFLAGGYSILCFKANRYVEYAVPFMVLETAVLSPFAWNFWIKEIWPIVQEFLKTSRLKTMALGLLLTIIFAGFAGGSVKTIIKNNEYYQAKQYETATDWIKTHVPANETVFHNSWDYSLVLWYLDDTHYYLGGLDPTFMYDYDKTVYDLWDRLSKGEETDVEQINSVFKSRVVVIDKRFDSAGTFAENLTASGLFTKVAENEWVEVYADPELIQKN